ncbi:MAG: DUF952 domain-containing protein [Balneola sp.]
MEYDLLFTVIDDQNWKDIAAQGTFHPASLDELGYIKCIDEKDLEKYINKDIHKGKKLTLVVIDPLRVKNSIKSVKQEEFKVIQLFGELTLDAIIDKIDLKPSKKGDYTISVKHYD